MKQLFIFVGTKLAKQPLNSSVLKKKILNILKYTAFTSLGVLMFWLVYRDQDFSQYWYRLKNEVNYTWIVVSLFLGLLSHISRTLRWKIALEPLGENPKTTNTFMTVMIAYFMNLLLPRMGEFVRCGLLSKYEKIPFSKLFGTVVTERIVDMIMLLFLTLLMVILNFNAVIDFGHQNPEVVGKIKSLGTSPILWGGFAILIIGVLLFLKFSKKVSNKNKIKEIITGFIEGIKSIFAMKRYKAYIAHSILIWGLYFLMLYVTFFSLNITKDLGPLAALTTFVMASFGMVAPSQGGIGAWHFMAASALGLFGVDFSDGKFFAFLAHTSTNALIIVLGAICLILLPIINRKYDPKPEMDINKKIDN
jgi:glycosyltransferase 2 family protein